MHDHEDSTGGPLTFAQFVGLLQQPPFEPCESELQYLTPAEYEEAFTVVWRLYFRPITHHIAGITRDYDNAPDLAPTRRCGRWRRKSSLTSSPQSKFIPEM